VKPKGLRRSCQDYADVAQWRDRGEEYGKGEPTDTPALGDNIGAMAAAVLAAAGATLCNFAGRVACETDYLAISGAVFPSDVPREELEDFNRRTLRECMSEADEQARYAAVAGFWRRRNHV
jgi:hypothetical protein